LYTTPGSNKQNQPYDQLQAASNKILTVELLPLPSYSRPAHHWLQKIPRHWGNRNFDHSNYILGKKFYAPYHGTNFHICSYGMHPAPYVLHAFPAYLLDIY